MRTCLVRAAIVMALVPAVAGAQSLSLTESEALARLSPDSPRVRAIRAGVDVARADVLAAGRWPNPRVTFDRESVAGITEYMTMVAQPLPITGRRGLRGAGRVGAGRRQHRAAPTKRCGALRADLRLAFAQLVAAQTRERELTAARDRLRELADVLAEARSRRRCRRIRSAARRTRGARPRRRPRGRRDRSRARAGDARRASSSTLSRSGAPRRRRQAPSAPVDAAAGRRTRRARRVDPRRAARAAARGRRGAASRRARPTGGWFPSRKSSPARSRRRSAAAISAASSRVHATIPLFDRGAARTRAGAGAGRQAQARADAFRLTLRARDRRAARRRRRARAGGRALSRRGSRAAPIRSSASRRSATTPASAASSSCSTPTARRRRRASGRRRSTPPCAQAEIELEFVSGWEIPMNDSTHERSRRCSFCCVRWRWRMPQQASGRRSGRAADARRDQLDRQDRAVHGVSAARRRTDGAASPCT